MTAKIKAITSRGMKDQKIQRQFAIPKINPVKVGPMAGANMITNAMIPFTAPNFWGGKICIATANISGKISPVPIPWIIRPVNRRAKPGAMAESTLPKIKTNKAKMMILRVENHFEMIDERGMMIPIISM